MGQDVNMIIGGMDQNMHPSKQKANTTREVLNFVPVSENGNLHSVTNESGTRLMANITFPAGFRPIGYSVLNSDIIVVLADNAGNNQVGYIVEDQNPDATYGFYHPVAPLDPISGTVPVNNTEFGFTLAHPVDCVSRKLINGHRILYFTDNNVPYGRVDLESPPEVGTVADEVKLTFNQKLPVITIAGIVEGATSTIQPGIVQFITRYITDTGGETTFGIPTNPMPMVPTNRSDGADNYQGAFYEDDVITKNIKLQIDNIDTKFAELELIAIYYEGTQSIFKASVVGQIPISSDSLTYTYTGPDTEAEVVLTREELRKIPISYTHAKCIAQKDNILHLSNLRDTRVAYTEELQEIANDIRVKYRTQEFQFSGRGGDTSTSTLVFTNIGNPYIVSPLSVVIPMSEYVDPITGVVLTSYELIQQGQVATSDISVLAFGALVDGDTISIGAGPSQLAVVFTARTTPTLPDEFAIGIDNPSTASNIIGAINTSTNVSQYVAIPGATADDVKLLWSVIDITANGTTVVYSGLVTTLTTTNFAGANTTPSVTNPTSVTIANNEITLVFANTISTSDTIAVVTPGINNTATTPEIFVTATSGLPVGLTPPATGAGGGSAAGFTDYTNEVNTVTSKGYRRDEAYSLSYAILWKDGTTTPGFHIPAHEAYVNEAAFIAGTNRFDPGTWPAFSQVNNSVDYVGTYVSDNEYPLDQKYPGDLPGDDNTVQGPGPVTARKIRHHLMPKLENEPHYRKDTVTGIEYIRILSLDFEFVSPIPSYILAEVEEIIFLRERRNNDTNTSIVSQGVTNNTILTADNFDNDGKVTGTTVNGGTAPYLNMKGGYIIKENPFFNMVASLISTNPYMDNGSASNSGMAYPNYVNPGYGGNYTNGYQLDTEEFFDQVIYHSPETNLLTGFRFDANTIIGADLEPVLLLEGTFDKPVNMQIDRQSSHVGTFVVNENFVEWFMYCDIFANFTDYDQVSALPGPVTIDESRYNEANVNRIDSIRDTQPGLKSSTRWNQGGMELLTDADVPTGNLANAEFQMVNKMDPQTNSGISYAHEPASDIIDVRTGLSLQYNGGDLRRFLFNIKRKNASQYGQISLASYIPIDRKSPVLPGGGFRTTYTAVFGGDTFISKYAFNAGQLIPYWPFRQDGGSIINRPTFSKSFRNYGNIDGVQGNTADGWDFKTCTYIFIESNINTHYRHRPEDEVKQDYFPNETDLSVLLNNYLPIFGNIRAYNTQYSYENNVREYFLRGSVESVVSAFENRDIYSEQAAEDDTLDAYRSFLQNDYYDLPSETGPIWDTFIEYNTLFMHTPKSLWRTFAEPAATIQGGNIEDAVLGTGRLFARPSTQVLETEGGYGGTISQFGGAHTKLGYIFVDILQGKVFAVASSKKTGLHLQELSKEGMSTYFHTNLPEGLVVFAGTKDYTNVTTLNSHLIDNPYIGIGIMAGYDYKLERYFLTKFAAGEHDGFTITFARDTNNWFSFHSYKPNMIIEFDNRVLFVRNQNAAGTLIDGEFHEMNEGPKGEYFGVVYDSEVVIVVVSLGKAGVFNNITIGSDSEDRVTGIKQRDDNFYELTVHNDRTNTGPYVLKPSNTFNVPILAGETAIKFRNDEYRIAIPRDSVINNAGDLFAPANLDNVNPPIRERIKGGYAVMAFKYDNASDLEFVLNDIKTIFINNFR